MKIACVIADGFEEVEFAASIGILRRGGCDIDIFSLHSNKAKGRYDLTVTDLKPFSSIKKENYDMLLMPGGPEYVELENNKEYIDLLLYFLKNDKYVAAICAAPTIIGHLGYLKNKNYTCFTSMNEDFGGYYNDVYAIKDGKLITGRSAAATIEFAFLILETVKGKEKAEEIKKQIYFYK